VLGKVDTEWNVEDSGSTRPPMEVTLPNRRAHSPTLKIFLLKIGRNPAKL